MLLNQVAQYKSAMERPFRAPTGSQRLFDLITPTDPRLSVAFYMALKDTLVASDLDTAMAAAYQGIPLPNPYVIIYPCDSTQPSISL